MIRHLDMFQYCTHLQANDLYIWIRVAIEKNFCNLEKEKKKKEELSHLEIYLLAK